MKFFRIFTKVNGKVVSCDWETHPELANTFASEQRASFKDNKSTVVGIQEVNIDVTQSGVLNALRLYASDVDGTLLLDAMQTPEAKRAVAAAMNASTAELGRAAVAAAKARKPIASVAARSSKRRS